ncbi:MAG: Na/Pi cotransporter family protein [Deltaproteobacteria bacterium]|nr:Na/Pi cotransporter family protein [Deltaproteobacteria bacterium]
MYGMRLLGEGLQKAVGQSLRGFLLSATSNRFKGVLVGASITALLQSSSATTVMLVGFVGSGLIGLSQTMGIILGADIGTTLTVQIIAFEIYDYAILILGVGILVRMSAKRGNSQNVGLALIGFGFVFLSLKILIETFEPLTASPVVTHIMTTMGEDVLAGIIITAILTSIFQSSAATLGLAITAAYSGLLTTDSLMPIVLGANIGTCSTAIFSSIGAPVDSKRVALAHILFKVIGVLIVLPFLGLFTELVSQVSSDTVRQVAYAHTFFNIAIAVLFLPFTGPFTRLVSFLVPSVEEKKKFGPKYLDPMVLSTPALALGQAGREALRIADIVKEMLRLSLVAIRENDRELLKKVENMDDDVDLLDREIMLYLTKLSKERLTDEQAHREFEILAFSNNLENIGDVIDKNLMELAGKKVGGSYAFSSQGMQEIEKLHSIIMENFETGVAAFSESDEDLARRLLTHKGSIAELERELRGAHIERLHKGLRESIDTSAIHLDILTNLKRINSYICNIAYYVIDKPRGE